MARESKPGKNEIKNEMQTRYDIYDIRPEHKWIPKPNLNARKIQKHSKP